ncbi:MAG: SUMF1/EgtB/PvdO family nonheme iron enzyme [Gemmataceae bacterium]
MRRVHYRVLLGVLLVVGLTAWELAAGWGGDNGRGRDWAAEMLRNREALHRHRATLPTQSPWYTTGPVANRSPREPRSPEKGVRLDATTADGSPVWTEQTWRDGELVQVPVADRSTTYLYRTIDSPRAMTLRVALSCEGNSVAWLNGKKLATPPAARRGIRPGSDELALDLKAGVNHLLVKVNARPRNCKLYYSIGPSPLSVMETVRREYPDEASRFSRYFPGNVAWFSHADGADAERKAIGRLLAQLKDPQPERGQLDRLVRDAAPASDPAWLAAFAAASARVQALQGASTAAKGLDFVALRLAIEWLVKTYPDSYPNGAKYLKQVEELADGVATFEKAIKQKDDRAASRYLQTYEDLRRNALVRDNPQINFDRILLVKREAGKLGLPQNWQGNTSVDPRIENEVASLDVKNPTKLTTVYRPAQPWYVGDLQLHFDAGKLLFSSIGANRRWQVFEMGVDGSKVTQVTPGDHPDIDSYNGIYLPDGGIIFDCNSTFLGVPCVGGADHVANLHLLSPDRKNVRRLCFEQDHDWYPTMMPDGRVMYLRWEYTDSAHYFSRVLMTMNPDGTNQAEYYGSNSYWPNGVFYAKPIPGNPRQFTGIVSGHHGVPRMGELVLFDVTRGRQSNSGAMQRISARGKPVEAIIKDTLVDGSWPKFLHPVPLSDKFFLVACKPRPESNWGIYLADAFDNLVLLREEPGQALLEPVPIRKTPVPPTIPSKIKPGQKTATVAIRDVYTGRGLPGVPRGTVKSLRLFQYEYSYRNMGGHYSVGIEGPWDIRRLIGTVPVHDDGSAQFEIPANTPVSVQPLDAEGKAVQQMRSWLVGMPGEHVSCLGCHENQNASIGLRRTEAMLHPPAKPAAWYGPKRGFSFLREVQPVLDKYCIGCHNGQEGRPRLDDTTRTNTSLGGAFPRSYIELHPFVRRNGPEGDYHTLTPLEFHADTSDLVQMLNKGHHNVKLDREAWDRLITWIDLNVPAHGTWAEVGRIPADFEKRRREMQRLYADIDEDIEEVVNPYQRTEKFVQPPPEAARPAAVKVNNWPFSAEKAAAMQRELGESKLLLDLGDGQSIELRRVPAGQFAMGDVDGYPDEYPTAQVRIDRPYWMGTMEVSLAQYQRFDPKHRNGYYDMHYKDQVKPGYLMDEPNLPVIRVTWNDAMAYCRWLSAKTGKKVTLPTEAQWEWACRGGTATSLAYGDVNTDFSRFANLGDRSLKKLAVQGVDPQPISNPDKHWDFVPKDERYDDGVIHLAPVGHYQANPWGLKDLHGNAAEWTRSTYRPYPYDPAREDRDESSMVKKAVRGGSWYDRPKHARSAFRQAYPAWQKVYNVGFRIVVED